VDAQERASTVVGLIAAALPAIDGGDEAAVRFGQDAVLLLSGLTMEEFVEVAGGLAQMGAVLVKHLADAWGVPDERAMQQIALAATDLGQGGGAPGGTL
jgi:hypothetical protein